MKFPPGNINSTAWRALVSTTPTDLVVTVPAVSGAIHQLSILSSPERKVWSDQAKDRTFRAISQAGFGKKPSPRLQDVILVSEPEAAALYTVKTLRAQGGDGFLVVSVFS